MDATTKRPLDIVAAVGLALGGVLGMAGSFVSDPNLRDALWAIDAVGLVVATSLLALKFFRAENDFLAAGFLVFAIGEGVMLTGTASSLEGSVPAFAAGIALWSAALLLTSIPKAFALWIRVLGILSSVLFGVTAARIFWGEPLVPTSKPLPSYAYPFLVLTFAGWIWTLLKEDRS